MESQMHSPIGPALPGHFTEPLRCRTAQLAIRRLSADVALIAAHGEIDAANSDEFVEYTLRQTVRNSHLVLDLTGIEFFGTAAFSALHTIKERCAAQGVDLAIAAGPTVLRLLRICDPDSALPIAQSVATAISAAQRRLRLLELIPKSR